MASTNFPLVDNNLVKEADDYIKKHRLLEIFEDLATAVAYNKPKNEDLCNFLIQRLELMKTQGLRGGIFTEEEARNVFKLFDLKQERKISKERCIKGLTTMANSSFQFELPQISKDIPNEVDENTFIELCRKFLGFSQAGL